MITIKEWMELVDYKITEGSNYGWSCYGPYSYTLDSWNRIHGEGGYSFSITFSTKSQKVYEVQVHDYTNDRAYRMINPKFQEKHRKEAKTRNVNLNEAWDNVDYVDLDVLDDFIQKALAIKASEPYDTRVQVQVDFSDEDLLQYMKMAHDRDMTFNAFVEEALRDAIEAVEDGRLTKEDAKKFVVDRAEHPWPFTDSTPAVPIDYKFVDEHTEEE
jgi:ribosomal protein S18